MSALLGSAINQAQSLLNTASQNARALVAYPRPVFKLLVAGRDISADVAPRLVGITLTDNRNLEADQLDIQLSDHDGLLAIPPRGAVVQLWLGWSDTGLVNKGSYTVDEVEHSGAPDVLNIRARSADLRGALKTKRERSWHQQTLGAIISAIAAAHGLSAVVSAALSAIELLHIDQANESDANLLTRLGTQHDAVATIKGNRLLFMPAGGSTTASGLPMAHVTLTRADGDQHRYLEADRDSYTGAKAYYYEPGSAAKKEAIAGGGDNLKELRHTYTDRTSALAAARAEWQRLKRGSATLSYTLAKGRPELAPEQTFSLLGIKAEIAAYVWLGKSLTHTLSSDSLTTSLELESQLPEADDLTELAAPNTTHTGVLAYYRAADGSQHALTAGDQSNPKRLPHLYASKASAQRAISMQWSR